MKLGEVTKVQGGYAFKSQEFQNEGVPIIRIGNLDGKNVEIDNDVCYPITFWDKHPEFRVEKNNILIAMSGATVGKIGLYESDEKALLNQRVCILKPDESVVTNEYLYFFCLSPTFKNSIKENAFGCAQPNISATQICDFEINVPDIEGQRQWVNQLRKIKDIIDKREKELEELDNLIKSRFVEMFGDRLESDTVKLSSLTEVITKGTTPTTLGFEFTDKGVNFVRIECMTQDSKFVVSKMLHISEECNRKLKRSILRENDVLFSIAGAIGRTAIVTSEILPANTNQAVAIIRLKSDCGLNVNFLNQMFHSSLIEKQVEAKKVGVAQINLSLADIGDFNVIVPPIEEQEQFSAFVEQVDKLKFEAQKSLDTIQLLFNSMMQKYFG